MNWQTLQQIVNQGESERVELKRSTGQRTDAAKTVCAMLNGVGGFVLFGVHNSKEIMGQDLGTETQDEVLRELQRIEPAALPDCEIVVLDTGRSVIVLRMSGGGGPYTYDGRPYVRVGTMTCPMPRAQFERLLLERMHAS